VVEPVLPSVRAYLALGSNLGDRHARLSLAVDALDGHEQIEVVAVSDLYETDPVGGPEQYLFLNLAVSIDTRLAPMALLEACQDIEAAAQRERLVRWGPRTLDIDMLLYGSIVVNEPLLTLPHPRMWERRFVIEPLADVAPNLVPVDWSTRMADQQVRNVGRLPTETITT